MLDNARKLVGAGPGDPEFETRYAGGLRRLIAHLTPEAGQQDGRRDRPW
jgi:hypothetical protein